MAPTVPPEMIYQESRIASFSLSSTSSSSGSGNTSNSGSKQQQQQTSSSASASSSSLPTWPHTNPHTHPYLTPKLLSEAGFYYTPKISEGGEEDQDNVTCFMCKKSLGGWEEGDHPFEEHVNRGGCPWALAVLEVGLGKLGRVGKDGKKRTYTQETLPSSSALTKARILTYGKSWPHKGKKAFLPSSVQKLAQAGFTYTPSEEYQDCTTCQYCEKVVVDWSATDDPWEYHHLKAPECPFFTAQVGDIIGEPQQQQQQSSHVSSKTGGSKSKPKPRSTVAGLTKGDVSVSVIESEEGSEAIEEEVMVVLSPVKRPTRTTKQPKTRPTLSIPTAPSTIASSSPPPPSPTSTIITNNPKTKAAGKGRKTATKPKPNGKKGGRQTTATVVVSESEAGGGISEQEQESTKVGEDVEILENVQPPSSIAASSDVEPEVISESDTAVTKGTKKSGGPSKGGRAKSTKAKRGSTVSRAASTTGRRTRAGSVALSVTGSEAESLGEFEVEVEGAHEEEQAEEEEEDNELPTVTAEEIAEGMLISGNINNNSKSSSMRSRRGLAALAASESEVSGSDIGSVSRRSVSGSSRRQSTRNGNGSGASISHSGSTTTINSKPSRSGKGKRDTITPASVVASAEVGMEEPTSTSTSTFAKPVEAEVETVSKPGRSKSKSTKSKSKSRATQATPPPPEAVSEPEAEVGSQSEMDVDADAQSVVEAGVDQDGDIDMVTSPPAVSSKVKKTKAKAAPKAKATKGGKKGSKKVVEATPSEMSLSEAEPEEVEMSEAPEEQEEEEEERQLTPKPLPTKSKSKSKPKAKNGKLNAKAQKELDEKEKEAMSPAIIEGAREVKVVMANLGSTLQRSPISSTGTPITPTKGDTQDSANPFAISSPTSNTQSPSPLGRGESSTPTPVKSKDSTNNSNSHSNSQEDFEYILTEAQEEMTVEQFIRSEMESRYKLLQEMGKQKIRAWEEAAKEKRERIVAIPTIR